MWLAASSSTAWNGILVFCLGADLKFATADLVQKAKEITVRRVLNIRHYIYLASWNP